METYLKIRQWQLDQLRKYCNTAPEPSMYLKFVAWSHYWSYPFWRVLVNAVMRFKGIDPNEIESEMLTGLRLAGDAIGNKVLQK
jgi:hypothetical protein